MASASLEGIVAGLVAPRLVADGRPRALSVHVVITVPVGGLGCARVAAVVPIQNAIGGVQLMTAVWALGGVIGVNVPPVEHHVHCFC
jgi:hypothetical protein